MSSGWHRVAGARGTRIHLVGLWPETIATVARGDRVGEVDRWLVERLGLLR